ncbi:MAG: ABC transporter permease [Propionibacteriaceae bacterium]
MAQITATPALADVTSRLESHEERNTRWSTGILIAVFGLLLLLAATKTHGAARFALSDAFDAHQLPKFSLPGFATVVICAFLCLAAAAAFIVRSVPAWLRRSAGVVAAFALIIGFICWAVAGHETEFLVTNQLQGTLMFATPLVLGAMTGVLSERSGVVNIAIEGQMLTAALAASIIGSVTQSIVAGIIGAVVISVLMSALLAVFSIYYLVDQVVLGVIINMFAAGLTGFLYDNVVKLNGDLNIPPRMLPVKLPGLSDIPFVGPILFSQLPIVYIAAASVALVWFLLYKTTWGLRVRAVGEHPLAADTVGINVRRIRWSAVLVGGIFAGLGGTFFTMGFSSGFNTKGLTVGYGFIARAAVIMGRWHPCWSALMALFFGFVSQMALQFANFNTGVPAPLLNVVPHIATIIAVAGLIGRVRGPASAGTPYTK